MARRKNKKIIILQLKSTQDPPAFDNISGIIKKIRDEQGYRIRGHEVHQVAGVMRRTSVAERAEMVSRFCARNDLEYLTYHAPVLAPGCNLWEKDEKKRERVIESLQLTAREAEMVSRQVALAAPPVVVFHLTSYVPLAQLPPTHGRRIEMLQKAGAEFARLFGSKEKGDDARPRRSSSYTFAVENTYPRLKSSGSFGNIGPFHPAELARLAADMKCGTTLDLAHYQLYSNYLKYGRGNRIGDLDRQAYGRRAPGWQECIETLGDALVQLHISDARGTTIDGEALPLGKASGGEIPVASVLQAVIDNNNNNDNKKVIQGTLELRNGHLDGARAQLESARWLLENARQVF
ncbi:MAG: TIM barrel protein [Thermoproteota archaeon]